MITTSFNGTEDEARVYFAGQTLNIGRIEDNNRTCLKVSFARETEIHGRRYMASNMRLIGEGRKWADVHYYHPFLGWREVKNWDRITQVATTLWD